MRRPAWPLFLGLAGAIAVADQLIKAWIASSFEVGVPQPVIGDLVRIEVVHNSGALFGLFRDSAALFAVSSLVIVALIVWVHAQAGRSVVLSVALGLLLGGAIGNFADRVRLGYVVDFVNMGIGTVRFYTYNLADACITGAILLFIALSLFPNLLHRFEGDA